MQSQWTSNLRKTTMTLICWGTAMAMVTVTVTVTGRRTILRKMKRILVMVLVKTTRMKSKVKEALSGINCNK